MNKEGIEHAWKWFELHAKQRMHSVNFYIVIIAAILAADGAAIKDKQYEIGVLLGLMISLASALFFTIERRVRGLVRIGERALRVEEDKLAAYSGNPALRMVDESDRSAGLFTYGKTFYAMFVAFGLMGLVLASFSGWQLRNSNIHSNPPAQQLDKLAQLPAVNVVVSGITVTSRLTIRRGAR